MGFFSWKTSDTKRSIPNIYSEKRTFDVTMLLPDGRKFTEHNYEGYGVFGGKDFYIALAEINNAPKELKDDEKRNWGIKLSFSGNHHMQPRLVQNSDLNYDDVEDSEPCEHQGYFYE